MNCFLETYTIILKDFCEVKMSPFSSGADENDGSKGLDVVAWMVH